MTPAISVDRWQEAQRYEAEYWAGEERNPEKLRRDIEDGHHFTAGVLDIRPATVGGLSVIDIAGGPYPLAGDGRYGHASAIVIDPMQYPETTTLEGRPPVFSRVFCCAEDYVAEDWIESDGPEVDEVWGYNVLQHVRDPAEVMLAARRLAPRIRWFDVVDTPIYPVHPHSISADWLRAEMSKDGFRIVRDIDGSRLVEGTRQKWVALVAEKT